IACLEAPDAPAAVDHVRRIASLHNPADHFAVFAFRIELKEAMWIGPGPFHDGSLQRHSFCRIVFEVRRAMMRAERRHADYETEHQREKDGQPISHVYLHPCIAFRISESAGCSLISSRIPLGSVTFARTDPLLALGLASVTIAPACLNCMTEA